MRSETRWRVAKLGERYTAPPHLTLMLPSDPSLGTQFFSNVNYKVIHKYPRHDQVIRHDRGITVLNIPPTVFR